MDYITAKYESYKELHLDASQYIEMSRRKRAQASSKITSVMNGNNGVGSFNVLAEAARLNEEADICEKLANET